MSTRDKVAALTEAFRDAGVRSALDALKADGYVVVKLPDSYAEQDGVTYFGDGYCAASTVQASPGTVYHNTCEYEPGKAREIGAYWLAAAEKAEASDE
ncbi:hypothetical protein [Mycolicibacterium conceptionense]|uniref:hypothetical protein n=1 Tax=Mycolicibacterium conceptionense TaxID=451644 RepID=UPI0013A54911|nr:hypothetical protein [Mycolicibacterium conceptionense]